MREEKTMRADGSRGGKARGYRGLQAVVRTLAFILSKIQSHWGILIRGLI